MNKEAIKAFSTILGNKSVAECAVAYLARCREMPTPEQVSAALRVPAITAKKIVAAASMSSLYLLDTLPVNMSNPNSVGAYLSDLKNAPVEHVVVLTLACDNSLINRHECASGTSSRASVEPSTVFHCAIRDNARSIIVVHNHPSGSTKFTEGDYEFSQRLVEGAQLLNLRVLDSILITHRGMNSMRAERPHMFSE